MRKSSGALRQWLLAVVLLTVTELWSIPVGAAEGMTARQVSELQAMTSVAISPDGSLIAATRSVSRTLFEDENGPARSELHVIDAATGTVRPFVTGAVELRSVSWSPDGGSIAFLAKRGDDAQRGLYRIPVAGGEATRSVSFKTDIRSYTWSPDGSRIAFIAREPRSEDDEELEDQGFNQQIYEEDWLPLGVWIADLDDPASEPKRLPLDGSAFQIRWSPAGDRLAVALAPRPLVDDEYMRQRVHLVSVETGAVLGIVDHEAKLGRVEWSPNGSRLAMIAGVDIHDPSESSLWVVGASGGTPRNLTAGLEGHASALAWSDPGTILLLADLGQFGRGPVPQFVELGPELAVFVGGGLDQPVELVPADQFLLGLFAPLGHYSGGAVNAFLDL